MRLLLFLMLAFYPATLFAPPIGFGGRPGVGYSGNPYPRAGSGVSVGQVPVVVNPPFMYDPNQDLYDWKIGKDENEPVSCYYDSYYGQYLGNCLLYQDAPGYSITLPNQIRR